MKKSTKVGCGVRMAFRVIVPGLVFLALMVSFPFFAAAEGDTAGDAKLQAVRSDLEACMQPGDAGKQAREAFAKKHNVPLAKLNEGLPAGPPAGNNGWDETKARWICGIELVFDRGVGLGIWYGRKNADNYVKGDDFKYCIHYSMHCDHYNWKQYCLKKYERDCCR